MKALVTGSTGFIGSQLCRVLVEKGHSVRAFHRATSNLKALQGLPVEHAIGDLTQPETVAPALEGMEVLFHAAALLGYAAGRDQAARMYAVTVEGTRDLYAAALEAGVRRVVHTSSVAALGVPDLIGKMRGSPNALMDENHTWNYSPQGWPYGYSKYLAELEAQKAAAQGLDVVIVNPSVVFGAGDIYRQNSSIIMQVADQRLHLITEGGLNAVHIADVVEGHLAALERGKKGERYILGGENLTHVDLVQRIARLAGVPAPRILLPGSVARSLSTPLRWFGSFVDFPVSSNEVAMAGWYFYFDPRKAQSQLGLPSPRPVDDALAEALAWFRQAG